MYSASEVAPGQQDDVISVAKILGYSPFDLLSTLKSIEGLSHHHFR